MSVLVPPESVVPSVSVAVPTVPVVMIPLLLLVMLAVVDSRPGRRTTGPVRNQRYVVVHAEVAGAVVVGEQGALLGERLPQVAVLIEAGESLVVGLVLQDDQPDVLDARRPGCPWS